MAGTKIFIFLLPLLCLDGVHLKKRAPQAGKPWIPPAHTRSLPEDSDDRYVDPLYQTPDAVQYPPVQAIPPARSNKRLRGFRCPEPNGFFRYTHKCDEYVNCTNYIPIPSACPPGLYFNPDLKGSEFPCDRPNNVDCDESETPYEATPEPSRRTATTPPTLAQPEEVDFYCPDPYGYYRHKQCDRYVECKNYIPLVFTCPAGRYFNPRSSWTDDPCDERSRSYCKKAKQRPALSTPEPRLERRHENYPRPVPRQRGFRCPQPHGYYRHSDQCNSYVECKNYVPMTYTCPPGLHFNPNIPWTQHPCHHPWKAQCEQRPEPAEVTTKRTTTTTTEPTTVRTTERPAPITPRYNNPEADYYQCREQNGYFPHSDQCGQYIECKNYVPLRYTCPVGLHFNPRSQWIDYPCAHPSEVQCNPRRETTEAPTTTPAPTTTLAPTSPAPKFRDPEDDEEYECKRPYGYFPHSECDEYIECKNYIPRTYACPAGLYFNPAARWTQYPCDHPSRVRCNNYK